MLHDQMAGLASGTRFNPIRFRNDFLGGLMFLLPFDVMASGVTRTANEGLTFPVFSLDERFSALGAHLARVLRLGFRLFFDVFALRVVRASDKGAIAALFDDER